MHIPSARQPSYFLPQPASPTSLWPPFLPTLRSNALLNTWPRQWQQCQKSGNILTSNTGHIHIIFEAVKVTSYCLGVITEDFMKQVYSTRWVGELQVGSQFFCPPELVQHHISQQLWLRWELQCHQSSWKCGWGKARACSHVKYFRSHKSAFQSVKFHDDHKTVTKLRQIWPPSIWRILPDLKLWRVPACHVLSYNKQVLRQVAIWKH